jgi:predicted phosphodiesterase
MRIAVVSDSHGTLTALEAVFEDLRAQSVDEVLLGGDLAQGGRQPAEVLDRLISLGWPAVLGNADLALLEVAAGGLPAEGGDAQLVASLRWGLDRLSPAHLDYLRNLPRQLRRQTPAGGFVLVHATPWSVTDVVRPDAPLDLAERVLAEAGVPIVAYGHIHHAYQRRLAGGLLASVGAVGGSLDGDPRAAYSIFTFAEGQPATVEVRRVVWDGAAEVAALRASGFPLREARAHQLVHGSYPS